MPADIQKHTLLVVSDTPARKTQLGIQVYEPVLRELKMLIPYFDNIIWLTSNAEEGKYAMTPCDKSIDVVIMPSVYHKRWNWLFSIVNYPVFAFYILKYLGSTNYVHTRGPSHPALITAMLCTLDNRRKYWHKYAGDWMNSKMPFTYRLQKKLLGKMKSNAKVTVNGSWNNAGHILSFENPCIAEAELQHATKAAANKSFDGDLTLLYAGNLYEAKGVLQLLEALAQSLPTAIKKCIIAGDGMLRAEVERRAKEMQHVNIVVTGALNREELNRCYEQAHILILPSASEGFPKVVAEAAAYGCIPVVTALSAIPQYIKTGVNGYLLNDNKASTISDALHNLVTNHNLEGLSKEVRKICPSFTYEYYAKRVTTELFDIT